MDVLDFEALLPDFLPAVEALPVAEDFLPESLLSPAALRVELFSSPELLLAAGAFLPADELVPAALFLLLSAEAADVLLAELFAVLFVAAPFSAFVVDFALDGASFVLFFVVAMVQFVLIWTIDLQKACLAFHASLKALKAPFNRKPHTRSPAFSNVACEIRLLTLQRAAGTRPISYATRFSSCTRKVA